MQQTILDDRILIEAFNRDQFLRTLEYDAKAWGYRVTRMDGHQPLTKIGHVWRAK